VWAASGNGKSIGLYCITLYLLYTFIQGIATRSVSKTYPNNGKTSQSRISLRGISAILHIRSTERLAESHLERRVTWRFRILVLKLTSRAPEFIVHKKSVRMEGKLRKRRIVGKKGVGPSFFTLPLSFHSYTFLMDNVNAFHLWLHASFLAFSI
jgi:hypothetical protein